MTALLWVLAATGVLLVCALAMLAYALFLLVRGPIRVVDVTPDEPIGIAPAQAMRDVGLDPEAGLRRLRPGGWPHS